MFSRKLFSFFAKKKTKYTLKEKTNAPDCQELSRKCHWHCILNGKVCPTSKSGQGQHI